MAKFHSRPFRGTTLLDRWRAACAWTWGPRPPRRPPGKRACLRLRCRDGPRPVDDAMEQRQDGRAAAPAHCPATGPPLDEPAAAAARPAAPARSEIADTLRLHRQDHWHDELRTGGRAILVTLTLR